MARSLGQPVAEPPDPRQEQDRLRFALAMEELFTLSPRAPGAAPLEFSMRLG